LFIYQESLHDARSTKCKILFSIIGIKPYTAGVWEGCLDGRCRKYQAAGVNCIVKKSWFVLRTR